MTEDKASRWKQLTLFDEGPVKYRSNRLAHGSIERLNDYDSFTEKFKPRKTTDDCYTPPAVYEAIIGWLKDEGHIDDSTPIVRPFFPGMDYTQRDYPEGCVVVDNPPFSIYAQIVRFYLRRDIKFFLFGPQLTLAVRGADVCYLPVNAVITYENGAKVNTGFVTNLIEGVRIWTAPALHHALTLASPPKQIMPKNTYPYEVITCALMGKISSREVDLKIMANECEEINQLQSLHAVGKSLFGGGWLLSERAAAERAAAERAAAERAAAERAAGTCVQLSEYEQYIIKRLSSK